LIHFYKRLTLKRQDAKKIKGPNCHYRLAK